ncbi:hypothetical protein KEM56_007190 [Ascosphaera pollenicola]|nr:hypothetical protein KEM56_007190 [Ascosphaera pollenicola]
MEGSYLANTHGFALPMTDTANARESVPGGKPLYGPNNLKNDSAVSIIQRINKPHTEATTQPAALSAAKNALGVSDRAYRPAAGVKKGKPSRPEGPWNVGRESRPLPHDSLAGVPRPQTGEKYTLIDKRLGEHRKHTSGPVREQAIELLRNEERERQTKHPRKTSGAQSGGTSSQDTVEPVQVLPAFDESGWMLAPNPQPELVALESPEVGVHVKTTDEQPISLETARQAERLDAATRNAVERQQGPSYGTSTYATGQPQIGDVLALDTASQKAADREARARDQVSDDLASLETDTCNAKNREDEYRAKAEQRIEGHNFATREANANAMIGKETANQQPVPFSATVQQTPAAYQRHQESTSGAATQQSDILQATAQERQDYENAVHMDEYNRFKDATGIGKPPEPMSVQQGPFGQAKPVGQHEETFKETLMYKAKEKRHRFIDTLLCRRKDRAEKKAAKNTKQIAGGPNQSVEGYDDDAGASAGAKKAGKISDSMESEEANLPTRKGIIAGAQADAGHGISHQAPSPLGRTLGVQKNRPAPVQPDYPVPQEEAGVGKSSIARPTTGGYGPTSESQQPVHGTIHDFGEPQFAQNEAVHGRAGDSTIPAGRVPQQSRNVQQGDWSADPAKYSAPDYANGARMNGPSTGGLLTQRASVQGAPERPSSAQEVANNVSGKAQTRQHNPPLTNM